MTSPSTSMFSRDEWKPIFDKSKIPETEQELLFKYADRLVASGVPVIFNLRHLGKVAGFRPRYLASVINASHAHYREFSIPKRSGGKRTITAPYSHLLELQRWILDNILTKATVHSAAHAYRDNYSIITNARAHLSAPMLLKMDLKDFFPSVDTGRVISVFRSFGYTHRISYYLAAICMYQNGLPQGAPTSPALSNAIAFHMDNRLHHLAKRFKLTYTRYADDMAFSGEYISDIFAEHVKSVIANCGFIVNDDKTRHYRGAGRRILTGISISGKDGKLRLPRDYRRELRHDLFELKRSLDLILKSSSLHIDKIQHIESLNGKLRFWISVEGMNDERRSYVEMMEHIRKLKGYVRIDL